MTKTKRELFDKELQVKASVFKELGHPAGQSILRHLSEIKTCVFGDISDELPLSSSTVSQHLKKLKEIGLICGTVLNNNYYFSVFNLPSLIRVKATTDKIIVFM